MPKCSGVIGYALAGETQPGVWSENTVERTYYGEVVRDNRRVVDQGEINGSVNINNNISVVSNKFMLDNMAFMRYISFANSKWKITSVDIRPPRIIITLGGLYNG
jgi:hypothetical protein